MRKGGYTRYIVCRVGSEFTKINLASIARTAMEGHSKLTTEFLRKHSNGLKFRVVDVDRNYFGQLDYTLVQC